MTKEEADSLSIDELIERYNDWIAESNSGDYQIADNVDDLLGDDSWYTYTEILQKEFYGDYDVANDQYVSLDGYENFIGLADEEEVRNFIYSTSFLNNDYIEDDDDDEK